MCAWLQEQGLGLYVAQCQIWVKSGQTLLQASQHDLEKVRPSSRLHRQQLSNYHVLREAFDLTRRSCA